jgi:soluble lytic murein transglycosylase-like protein
LASKAIIPKKEMSKADMVKFRWNKIWNIVSRRVWISALLIAAGFIIPIADFREDEPAWSITTQESVKDQRVRGSAFKEPICFSEAIFQISWEYGIPPKLVEAIIQVESQGNPKAVSRKGALGLMQLMPVVIKAYQVADPFDPLANMHAGVRHLNYLLLEFSGDLSLALAAYNVGPGTVRRYGGVPPYPETRKYLSRVLKEYRRERNEPEIFISILKMNRGASQNIFEKNYPIEGSDKIFTLLQNPKTFPLDVRAQEKSSS